MLVVIRNALGLQLKGSFTSTFEPFSLYRQKCTMLNEDKSSLMVNMSYCKMAFLIQNQLDIKYQNPVNIQLIGLLIRTIIFCHHFFFCTSPNKFNSGPLDSSNTYHLINGMSTKKIDAVSNTSLFRRIYSYAFANPHILRSSRSCTKINFAFFFSELQLQDLKLVQPLPGHWSPLSNLTSQPILHSQFWAPT